MNTADQQPSRREVFGSLKAPSHKDEPLAENPGWGPLFHFSANGMGCQFQILCGENDHQAVAKHANSAFELLAELEDRLSIFRPHSEMARINRDARRNPVTVRPDLFELIEQSSELARCTAGAFDISTLPLTRLWKQCRQERTLPDTQQITEALHHVGMQHVLLDPARQSVSLQLPELQLDLGAIGKGFALDQLKQHLQNAGCEHFLIHGGQSSVVVSGSRSAIGDNADLPWQIGISHPLSPQTRLATINPGQRAIGTSGSGRKGYVLHGKRYGHIVDPGTGWPADHFLSVSVLAETAVLADALSTAMFVAGPDHVETLCEQFGASALWLLESSTGLEMETVRLEDSDWTLESSNVRVKSTRPDIDP